MFQQLLQQAFDNLEKGNNELALVSILPIFDNACKKKWKKLGVGARFRKGVEETEEIITFLMASGSCLFTNCKYGELKLPELIYKYLRNSIIHEGKMPDNVGFVNEPKIIIEGNSVKFPVQFVSGLLIASIGFECYKKESNKVTQVGKLLILDKELFIKDLVGTHQPIREIINAKFKNSKKT